MPEVMREFPGALAELTDSFGANEFHFADIYAGRGVFKSHPFRLRMAVFEFMTKIFITYRFQILVQTLDPSTLATLRAQADFPNRLGPLNLEKQEDFALFLLLIKIKNFLAEDRVSDDTLARVFVDEGFKQNGVALKMPLWEHVFADGLICFARSHEIQPIQLADFAAFVMNRTQLLYQKKRLNERDEEFLAMSSQIGPLFRNLDRIDGTIAAGRFEPRQDGQSPEPS